MSFKKHKSNHAVPYLKLFGGSRSWNKIRSCLIWPLPSSTTSFITFSLFLTRLSDHAFLFVLEHTTPFPAFGPLDCCPPRPRPPLFPNPKAPLHCLYALPICLMFIFQVLPQMSFPWKYFS